MTVIFCFRRLSAFVLLVFLAGPIGADPASAAEAVVPHKLQESTPIPGSENVLEGSDESAAEADTDTTPNSSGDEGEAANGGGASSKDGSERSSQSKDGKESKEAAPLTTAEGDIPDPASGEVDDRAALLPDVPYSGTYTHSVAIRVPAFRGIEPKLRLGYASGRGWRAGDLLAGFVATGWSLDGVSSIVRVSKGRGTPRFDGKDISDTTDTFLHDGQEIVLCPPKSKAPSCRSGGNYVAKVENYLRYSYSTKYRRWKVTARDGTVHTYTASGDVKPGASTDANLENRYNFLLTSVTDRNGNTVKYSYGCASGVVCYPTKISYNQTEIVFYRFHLNNPAMVIANGGDNMGRVTYRLRTILVRTSGSPVRAYALNYETAGETGAALLKSVQEYGKDVVLNSTGTVTGGTALPPSVFKYSSHGLDFFAAGDSIDSAYERVVLDLNGDQRSDVLGYKCSVDAADPTCSLRYTTNVADTAGSYKTQTFSNIAVGHTVTGNRWIVGDFEGDGSQQLLRIISWKDPDTAIGTRAVLYRLNRATNELEAKSWLSLGFGGLAQKAIAGDFNSDGRTELFFDNRLMPLSTGGDEKYILGTQPVCSALSSYQVQTGDFDGDGRTDLVCHEADASGTHVAVLTWNNSAKAFEKRETAKVYSTHEAATEVVVGDINGDGKSDVVLINQPNKTVRLLLSNGKILVKGPSTTVSSVTAGALVGDFDGDGRSDIFVPYEGDAAKDREGLILRLKGATFLRRSLPDVITSYALRAGDFNGDGKSDFLALRPWLSKGPLQDLLTEIASPSGATTKIAYEPSTTTENRRMPFVLQRVSSIERQDGRGTVATTRFSYSDGIYSHGQRRFYGFRTVTMTLPCSPWEGPCPTRDYVFRQDAASAGKIELVTYKNGAGGILRTVDEEWKVNDKSVPYTAQNIATTSTERLAGGDRARKVERAFDMYGNLTVLKEHGWDGVAGDERTTLWSFMPNTGPYIVNRPSSERVFAALSEAGSAEIARSYFHYDYQSSHNLRPVKGNVTLTRRWMGGDAYANRSATYDAYGNRVTVTDEVNRTTETRYDPTYRLYPEAVIAGGRTIQSVTWDFRCGKPRTSTDLSGLPTTYDFDALCRPKSVTRPGGEQTRWEYHHIGDPNNQRIDTITPLESSTITVSSYLDGFGKVRRTSRTSPRGPILVDSTYSARGLVRTTTAPYYTGDASYPTTFDYDGLDRPVTMTRPDGTKVTTAYQASAIAFDVIETRDEIGRVSRAHRDAYGRTIQTDRPYSGAAFLTTRMTYDRLGRMTGVRSPAGSEWTYAYDALGRRIRENDPDRGEWHYFYNAAGELVEQIDARGEKTAFTYDDLGRLVTKTARAGAARPEVTVSTYDEARAGFVNGGRLTSLSNAAAAIRYDYDASGRRMQDTYEIKRADGGVVERHVLSTSYEPGGRVKGRAWTLQSGPAGRLEGWTYDAAGRLDAIPGRILSTSYDAADRPLTTAYANGTATVRTYDPLRGWLDSLTSPGLALTYTRNAAGRIERIGNPVKVEEFHFTYNDADWLLSSARGGERQTFAYDLAGNMLLQTGPTPMGATFPSAHAL